MNTDYGFGNSKRYQVGGVQLSTASGWRRFATVAMTTLMVWLVVAGLAQGPHNSPSANAIAATDSGSEVAAAASVRIPGNTNTGVRFQAERDGAYTFRYHSGAYSVYAAGAAPPGYKPWLTTILLYPGTSVPWDGDRIRDEQALAAIADAGTWFTQGEATRAAAGKSETITLSAGTYTLIAVDHRSHYSDNPGSVELAVEAPTPAFDGCIPGRDGTGIQYTAQQSGLHVLKYRRGAYATYPIGQAPPGFRSWLTSIAAFRGSSALWDGERIRDEDAITVIADAGTWFSSSDAEAAARGKSSAINLRAGEVITLIAVDSRSWYADNPGEVCLDIEMPGPSDPWWLTMIRAREAWGRSRGSRQIVIAIIDTGTDYTHEELTGWKVNTAGDWDFINGDDDAMDDHAHGTHVGGISAALADNGLGIAGVCPECILLPIKVLSANGQGTGQTVASGIRHAVDRGVDVINLSLGGSECSPEIADAINYAYEAGIVIVASSGNSGQGECPAVVALTSGPYSVGFPGAFSRVISVGATDRDDKVASFSSTGPEVDISAPGVGVLSSLPGNKYGERSGTSMSAPMVAGTAGLLLSLHGRLSPDQVKQIIERSAVDIEDPGYDERSGWGRLDTARALAEPPAFASPQPPAACPPILDRLASTQQAGPLATYRAVRDQVFASSSVGMRLSANYYQFAPEVAGMLLVDPELRREAADLLRDAEDEFASLLPGAVGRPVLRQELVTRADTLVNSIASRASSDLREALLAEWNAMGLTARVGEEVPEIWRTMQPGGGSGQPQPAGSRLYIPFAVN